MQQNLLPQPLAGSSEVVPEGMCTVYEKPPKQAPRCRIRYCNSSGQVISTLSFFAVLLGKSGQVKPDTDFLFENAKVFGNAPLRKPYEFRSCLMSVASAFHTTLFLPVSAVEDLHEVFIPRFSALAERVAQEDRFTPEVKADAANVVLRFAEKALRYAVANSLPFDNWQGEMEGMFAEARLHVHSLFFRLNYPLDRDSGGQAGSGGGGGGGANRGKGRKRKNHGGSNKGEPENEVGGLRGKTPADGAGSK